MGGPVVIPGATNNGASSISRALDVAVEAGIVTVVAIGNGNLGIAAHPAFWSPFIMMGNTKAISVSRKGEMFPCYIGGGILFLVLGVFTMRRCKKEVV